MVAVDAIMLSLIGYLLAPFDVLGRISEIGGDAYPLQCVLITTSIAFLAAAGLYREGEHRRDYLACVRALAIADCFLLMIVLLLGLTGETPWPAIGAVWALFWAAKSTAICVGRFGTEVFVHRARERGLARYSAFIIAEPDNQIATQQLIASEGRYNILGFADSEALDRDNREALIQRIKSLNVDEIFTDWDSIHRRTFLFRRLQSTGATLRILPLKSDISSCNGQLWSVDRLTLFTLAPSTVVGLDFFAKRCFDFILSILILTFFSPIYLAIACLIKLDSPGPVFYKQWRVGLHGKEFQVWKFRSMVTDADKSQALLEKHNEMADGILFKLKSDPRVTRVGKFIRRYSLDELPQVFNVLMGDMSLIGPRPLPVRDVERFSKESFYIRHEVLPGITGLWQVSGRSDIEDFERAVSLDMQYIESWSLMLDLVILVKTFSIVLSGRGAY